LIQASPDNVQVIAAGLLDHPEGIAVAPDGTIYAGGEAGQIYRVSTDGAVEVIAETGGFILGIALDGAGNLYACDQKNSTVLQINISSGTCRRYSTGTPERRLVLPNFPAFDAHGNLFVSDSGDYWNDTGDGCIFVVRPNGVTELFHTGPFKFANGVALSPNNELYVAQSSAWNIVRVSATEPDSAIEVVVQLPDHSVPDGIAFTRDGDLIVACYRPDIVYLVKADVALEVLVEDLTAEFLMRPTNAALHQGRLYLANLGGWHLSSVGVPELAPAFIHRPVVRIKR
jgi:sugar lactone lactonase YvrE